MEIDAGLRAGAARLRAELQRLSGGAIVECLLALGVLTRKDLVRWEIADARRFRAETEGRA